jgi:hypothetical protein
MDPACPFATLVTIYQSTCVTSQKPIVLTGKIIVVFKFHAVCGLYGSGD